MRRIARRLNELLGRTVGVELTRADAVGIPIGAEWVQRFLWLDRLLDRVNGVEGDVAECGVASGSSLAMLSSLLRARGEPRHLHGFDSWSGLPAPGAEDAGPDSAARQGMFDWASLEGVRRELRAHGFDGETLADKVTLYPGPFDQTLLRFEGRLALLHVDADLHDSYRLALVNLWPRLQPGGIVAFDEYEHFDEWPGARRAVDEFLSTLPAGASTLERDDRIGKWYARKTG